MRTPQVALAALASLLLACVMPLLLQSSTAGEAGAPAEKEKPKEKPFKYDAWCVFSDLTQDRPYISPNAPIDPESEHSRPGSERLGGFGRRGQWAHVILDLKNTTEPKDKIVYRGEATIVLNHYKPSDVSQTTYGTTYRQSFVVAPQSEKTYHFSIFCPEEGWNPRLNLEIQTDNGRTYFRDFTLKDLDQATEELIVVVSDQPGAFKYLGPKQRNSLEASDPSVREEAGREVASVTPSELPARWHDLALASLIIVDGPPAGGLTPEQWDALKAYAQGGGKVLIMAGKDPARLKGAVEDLAGITVRNSAELASLDQFSTPFPVASEKNKELRVPVIEVTASATTGIVKRNSKTQIIEYCAKSYGAGMVAFLPFSLSDKMLENWPDRALVPLNLIRAEKNLFATDAQDDDNDSTGNPWPANSRYNPRQNRQVQLASLSSLRNELDTSFENDTPVVTHSPKNVMYFMLIYLACAVPLNYVIFSLLRRREAAWLMAPLWALTFTIIAYYVGYAGQTGVVTVNEVCVIEAGPGQSTGVGRTFMGVYAPSRNDYQVQFPGTSLGSLEAYDMQAAPGHLVNSINVERRDAEFPSMRLREDGENLSIENILIQQRSTRRFEIQHRAWLNRGLDLKFASPNVDQSPRPQVKIQNNTGRTLSSAVFIKGNEYIEVSANGSGSEFESGQSFDSNMSNVSWHSVDNQLVDKMSARFVREGGSQHDANRARAMATYLKTHMKQYAAGVFVAWADGASLPVKIGATGSKAVEPNLSGITLLVVPAQATNRGGRSVSLKKNQPVAYYTAAYNPEDRTSGDWKKCDAKPIPVKTLDEHNKKCVYLRLQFDPEFGQYVYEGKAAQLTLSISNRGNRAANFNGELNILSRNDGAAGKKDRFKTLYSEAIAGLRPNLPQKIKPIKIQFSDTDLFTGSAIVLKIQPEPDEGVPLPDSIMIEHVELKVIDR